MGLLSVISLLPCLEAGLQPEVCFYRAECDGTLTFTGASGIIAYPPRKQTEGEFGQTKAEDFH